jgi:5-formyltetrahydrofolate cyclo-ligase
MKQPLRQHYRALRRRHAPALQASLAALTVADLQALLARQLRPVATHVGLTVPVGAEPDLRPWLLATSEPLALPAVAAGRLLYRPWQCGDSLEPDACGIPAPLASAGDLGPEQLALLLVPALAFDRRGLRLGSGGGWYDRLRAEPTWRAVPALAVLPSACVCDRLPDEPWDVPFDGWLDEHGPHWI